MMTLFLESRLTSPVNLRSSVVTARGVTFLRDAFCFWCSFRIPGLPISKSHRAKQTGDFSNPYPARVAPSTTIGMLGAVEETGSDAMAEWSTLLGV